MPECKCSPLFKKGGQGGFYTVAHSFQSEHDYDTSYNAHRIMRKLFDDSKQIVSVWGTFISEGIFFKEGCLGKVFRQMAIPALE
jgi:hypothetical protein